MTTPRRRASDDLDRPKTAFELLHEKLDVLIESQSRTNIILEGRHDENGDHHPGLSHRVKRLENFLNWIIGLATTAAGLLIAWWFSTFGGKHP